MNWIAAKMGELMVKVDNALTAHSDLAARVAKLEEDFKEPAPAAVKPEATPAAGG
jgi:hypothetical protein